MEEEEEEEETASILKDKRFTIYVYNDSYWEFRVNHIMFFYKNNKSSLFRRSHHLSNHRFLVRQWYEH